MSGLAAIAAEQAKIWSALHKEAARLEKEDGDLTQCNETAIQLCYDTLFEVRDLVGKVLSKQALLEAGLQPTFIKDLLHSKP